MLSGTCEGLFDGMTTSTSVANRVNTAMKEVTDSLLESETPLSSNLSSHSVRAGSVSYANEHAQLLLQWIVQRGGWALDSLQTIFNYITGIYIYVSSF